MKKYLISIIVSCILIIIIIGVSIPSHAMGPIMISAHTATWDRLNDANVTGYYIYYRAQGINTWSSVNRSVIVAQPTSGVIPTYNLLNLITTNGNYEICATALDAAGDESGPSNIVPFVEYVPASPANIKVQ